MYSSCSINAVSKEHEWWKKLWNFYVVLLYQNLRNANNKLLKMHANLILLFPLYEKSKSNHKLRDITTEIYMKTFDSSLSFHIFFSGLCPLIILVHEKSNWIFESHYIIHMPLKMIWFTLQIRRLYHKFLLTRYGISIKKSH